MRLRPLIGITGRKDTSARLLHAPMSSVGETYVRAIHHVGGTPVIIPTVVAGDDWKTLFAHLDGLLLSGGGDIDPAYYGEEGEPWMGQVDIERDVSELGLVRTWVEGQRPLMAICRGHQVLNVAMGGTLYQDIAAHIPNALDHAYTPARPMEQPVHTVSLEPDCKVARILGSTSMEVNSAHHQAVKNAAKQINIVGRAPDGVVEAIELPTHPFCIGIQWHPEAMVKSSDTMWPLFEAFIAAAKG